MIAGFGAIILICIINSNILLTFGYDETVGNHTYSFCFEIPDVPSTQWQTTWGKVKKKKEIKPNKALPDFLI